MPNLNLKAGTPAPMPGVRPTGRPGGDGPGGKKIAGLPAPVVFILAAVILLGGGYFALNKAGILGKKKIAPVIMSPPPAVVEDTTKPASNPAETEGLVEFKEKPAFGSAKKGETKPGLKSTASMMAGKGSSTTSSLMAENTLPKIPMSSSGRYSVQVSSWSSEQKAHIEADVMTRAGFPAFVEKGETRGGGKHYRVYVGRYESDRAARNSAEKIAHMLEGGYWVVRLSK
ncbi:MAG TPA: SPOR domain-containing protein [Bacteroidota bacterium]|nr:SPOR domain-containing protein [Bacteroidota bacterium]